MPINTSSGTTSSGRERGGPDEGQAAGVPTPSDDGSPASEDSGTRHEHACRVPSVGAGLAWLAARASLRACVLCDEPDGGDRFNGSWYCGTCWEFVCARRRERYGVKS